MIQRRVCVGILLGILLFSSSATAGVEWQRIGALSTVETPVDLAFTQDGRWIFLLSAEHSVLIFGTDDGKLAGKIPVGEGIGSIAVSPNGERLFLADKNKKIVEALVVSFTVAINTAGSPFTGPARAPVEVVVFSDFQCPFCGKLVPVMEEVQERFPKDVKVVFMNFPLASHPFARSAAAAAMAAGEQGKFWEFHDQLFQHSSVLSEERIVTIAKELGLDMARFSRDKESPTTRLKLEQDIAQGLAIGLNSTPTVFVNGRKVLKRTTEEISRYVNEELQKARARSGGQGEKKK